MNEYKNIIQNSTLNSNINKSNFGTWHHIWNILVGIHPVYGNADVGHLNQDNNSNYFKAIYWNQNSGYGVINVDKISSEYLNIKLIDYNASISGGACFRPIIEYKE